MATVLNTSDIAIVLLCATTIALVRSRRTPTRAVKLLVLTLAGALLMDGALYLTYFALTGADGSLANLFWAATFGIAVSFGGVAKVALMEVLFVLTHPFTTTVGSPNRQ